MTDFGSDIIDKITVEWLRDQLTEEEWEILVLRLVEGLTFDEIGVIIGQKYRPEEVEELTGSAIRYHFSRIKEKCQSLRNVVE